MFKRKNTLLAIVFAAAAVLGFLFLSPSHAFAQFDYTDHLMDDSVMTATGTMSASDIQQFLDNQGSGLAVYSDVENCGSTSGAHYSYYATYYSCGQVRSAAQIIYDASQAYGINPQVILATMQKEQSLVTTPNPTSSQLTYAMGYGCPDSGGCSYPGFFNQVDNGTWQFRTDMELSSGNDYWGYTPSSYPCNNATRYYSTGLIAGNNVTFYDDYGSAYSQFTLPNSSTAALYCYTPHVYPGDSQEYYSGSYWFVYYFNRWFVPYSWQITNQYAYTDQTKTTQVNINSIQPGQRIYVGFTALNTGNMTWSNSGPNAVMVGTDAPMERQSVFSPGSGWLSSTRPALLQQATVAPGQTGTFEFWMTAPITPNTGGIYNERFNILANGITWFNDTGLSYYLNMQPPTYSWQITNQYAYTDQTKTTQVNINSIQPGQRIYVGFTALNTGNMTWSNSGPNAVMVGTDAPMERQSVFSPGSGWLSSTRPALLQQATVAPGQTGTFEFWMTAPITPNTGGIYNERFNILANGITWFNDTGLSYYLNMQPPTYSWQITNQYAYTDQTKTTQVNINSIQPGQRIYVGFTALNTGNMTWSNSGPNAVMVGTDAPMERQSVFSPGSGWLSSTRPALLQQATVAPGQTGTFEFWMTAPITPNTGGIYNERFNILANGITWFNDTGLSYYLNVQ